jgi:hypothetical protein
MNKERKARWVEALRSGRYKQATGALKKEDGYCCLGVACDLAAQDGVGKWLGDNHYGAAKFWGGGDEDNWSDAELTESVAAWLGIDETDPWVPFKSDEYDEPEDRALSDLERQRVHVQRHRRPD